MNKPVDLVRLRALWGSPLLDKVLAARLGHSTGTIRNAAKRIGLPGRKQARLGSWVKR